MTTRLAGHNTRNGTLSGVRGKVRARWRVSRRGPRALTAAVVAVALAAVGCSSGGEEASDDTIKFGAVLSLAGPFAPVGQKQKEFYQLAVDTFNERGGIDGRQVELTVENDKSDPAVAVSAAKKLVSDGVVAIVNPGGPATNSQTVPIFMKAKIPVITPTPLGTFTDPAKYPYFFDVYPTFLVTAKAMVSFLEQRQQTRVGFLSDGSNYSKDIRSSLMATLPDTIELGSPVTVQPTAADVTTQIQELKSSGVTTLVLGTEQNFVQIFQAIKQVGWQPLILASSAIQASPVDMYGDLAGSTFAACGTSLDSAAAQPSPELSEAIDIYVSKFEPTPTAFYFPIYLDTLQMLKLAIEEKKSTDGAEVKDYLETVNDQQFTAPELSYTFTDEDHAGVKTTSVCQVAPVGAQNIPISVATSQ